MEDRRSGTGDVPRGAESTEGCGRRREAGSVAFSSNPTPLGWYSTTCTDVEDLKHEVASLKSDVAKLFKVFAQAIEKPIQQRTGGALMCGSEQEKHVATLVWDVIKQLTVTDAKRVLNIVLANLR